MRRHYGVTEVPERVGERLARAGRIKDDDEAARLVGEAKDKMLIHCLAAWSNGTAPGPMTAGNLEERAKSAESLAKMLAKKGHTKAARKQLERARRLREKAARIGVEHVA